MSVILCTEATFVKKKKKLVASKIAVDGKIVVK